jgi:uroporphyrinogen decarboxylase
MTKREKIRRIVAGEDVGEAGLWLGNPHGETVEIYKEYFGKDSVEAIRQHFGDEFRWIGCWEYKHPEGRGMFPVEGKNCHGFAGPLADCETVKDVDAYEWPNPDHVNIAGTIKALKAAGDVYRASGMWTHFYHVLMDLFGMENYLIKMYTHPEVVEAATDRVCEFFYHANERIFQEAGDLIDGFFFGNDFGTQRDTICSPELFDRFIMPWFKRFTDLAHRYDYQVILHSCGSIHKVIGRLIDAGVDCLHPIQALAANMDAETLARDFGGKITFMGGVDTQDLLVNGTPEEVRSEVLKLRKALSPRLIVSPSHEAVLPNVPPQNFEAMALAAME